MTTELRSIQHLRAIAALMVVLFHLGLQLDRMGWKDVAPHVLADGVDIFFVISGFIMWITTHGRATRPLEFFRRRLLRIMPLYWLITGVMVAAMLATPSLLQSARPDAAHIVSSFLFIPARHPVLGTLEPVVVPGWTLNYEIVFYLIFGMTLALPRAARIPVCVAALAGVIALSSALAAKSDAAAFYGSERLLEFALGLLVGWIVTDLRPTFGQPRRVAWFAILAGAAGLMIFAPLAPTTSLIVMVGLPVTAIVWGSVLLETSGGLTMRLELLHRLGCASYALYLSHGIVLSAAGQIWRKLGLHHDVSGAVAFSLFAVVLASAVAMALHELVERPIARLLRRPRASSPGLPDATRVAQGA